MALRIDYIKEIVGRYYNIDINSKARDRCLVRPRQVVMYLSRLYTGMSYAKIGEIFGKRHHSTVLHACRAIKKLYVTDLTMEHDIDNLKVFLNAKAKRERLLSVIESDCKSVPEPMNESVRVRVSETENESNSSIVA